MLFFAFPLTKVVKAFRPESQKKRKKNLVEIVGNCLSISPSFRNLFIRFQFFFLWGLIMCILFKCFNLPNIVVYFCDFSNFIISVFLTLYADVWHIVSHKLFYFFMTVLLLYGSLLFSFFLYWLTIHFFYCFGYSTSPILCFTLLSKILFSFVLA